MGARFGLGVRALGEVVNDGSAWSVESERIFAALSSGDRSTEMTLGQMVDDLTELTRLAFKHGAPLLIANEVRAIFEAQKSVSGAEAGLDSLQTRFEQAANVRLSG